MSTNQKIARASIILIAASMSGHALSLVKEILVASNFGVGARMDAFYAALTIPNVVNNIFMSTFGAVFVPVFVKYRLKDKDEANRIASTILNYTAAGLAFFALLLFAASPFIIRYGFHGFSGETAVLASTLLKILCFTLIFTGLTGAMTGILNALEHFTWPAFTQMFITVFTIAFIVMFARQAGIAVLAWGLLAGLGAQFIFLVPVIYSKGYRHSPGAFNLKHPAIREIIPIGIVFLLSIVISHLNVIIDRVMASYLSEGSISALGYADKLVQVPLIIFASSLVTVAFPYFSKQIAENRLDELKDTLVKSITGAAAIFLPLTVITVFAAKPAIELLFQRGAFDSAATLVTSRTLVFYCLHFFSYTVLLLLIRVALALQKIDVILKAVIAGVLAKIALNILLMKAINPPIAGIALSTTAVYTINMLFMLFLLKRYIGRLDFGLLLKNLLKVCIASVACGFAFAASHAFIPSIPAPWRELTMFTDIAVPSIIAGSVFVVGALLLGVAEVKKALAMVNIG